ncbi:MAG: hypothetical protein AAGF81_13695 [Pseudomonadota bacterium]
MPNSRTIMVLKGGAVVLILFGILAAAGAMPALSAPTLLLLDLAFWPLDGAQSLAAPETRLLCAVGGGVLVGWGALLFLLADQIGSTDPALVRKFVIVSIGSWFVVDSLGSVAAGAPMNALFNVGFLLLFLIPVWNTERLQTQP